MNPAAVWLQALLLCLLLIGCSESSREPAASPTTRPAAAGPAAPGNVSISGALPNLQTPVPAGQGELGRITVSWQDNSNDETGFRIYQSCAGVESPLLEVAANTTSHGPIQSCRPGRVGVAAFNASGASPIVFAP